MFAAPSPKKLTATRPKNCDSYPVVYDAGTKSGEMLDYSGSPTQDPIKLRDYGLFAGNTRIGTFHFVRKL